MQIGIRLHDTENVSLEERIGIIKKDNFQCVHMALYRLLDNIPKNNAILTPGFAMYLKRLFAKADIDIAVLGCYQNLANPDPQQLREIMNSYKDHIRFASILGCGVVGSETGAPNVEYRFEPSCYSEEALNTFIKNLSVVVEYAESMGVIIAIEPVCTHIVHNAKRARKVLDIINSPNLQIIFDPVNMISFDNYKNQDMIIEEAIDLLGKDMAVIHMKDFIVQDQQIKSVAAGLGQLNYQPIIKFIRNNKAMIHCTLEDTTPENAVQAKEYIQKLYDMSR